MTQPLDYQPPAPKSKTIRVLPVGLAVLVFLLLFSVILIPAPRSHDTSNHVISASNLRQIGQAILIYSNESKGAYPPDLPTLISTEDITAEVFISPLSNDTEATGPTTRAIVDQLLKPGHCSYVYIGRGLNAAATPADAVVAYEPPTTSFPSGNVLFGDGHVEAMNAAWFKKLDKTLSARSPASTQPIMSPPER